MTRPGAAPECCRDARRAGGRLITILGLATLLVLGRVSVAAPDDAPLSVGSDDHLWLIVPAAEDEDLALLLHHARGDEPADVHRLAVLPQRPDALAAWGDRVWLMHESRRGESDREVYTGAARPHPVGGGWILLPADRLEVASPLPGTGRVAALAGTGRGPVALLLPDEADAPPRLLLLRSRGWEDLELPDDFRPGPESSCSLVAAGPAGDLLTILEDDPDRGIAQFVRGPDGDWTRRSLPAAGGVRSFLRVGGQVVGVRGGGDTAVEVLLVRPGTVLPITRFAEPAPPTTIIGAADGLRVFGRLGGEQATVRSISVPSGAVGEPVPLAPRNPDALKVLRAPTLIAILVFAVIFVILLRTPEKSTIELPEGVVAARASTRLAALAIDLVPGALLALVLTGARPIELFVPPFFVPDASASVPYLVMIGISTTLGLVGELTRGRTAGKAMLGLRVTDPRGERQTRLRILARNAVKLVVLLVPPLAVVVMLDPNGRGLQDNAGRTVVVRDAEATPGDA